MAVRTRVRSEKQVAKVLRYREIEAWAPTAPIRRRWSDRWKMIEWPLYPGYVFARVPVDQWYPLLDLAGVFTVVKMGAYAATLSPEIVENTRLFADRLSGVVQEPVRIPWFHIGDEVEIRDGPFEGIRGVVTRADGVDQISVGIQLLGQGVSVTLAAESALRVPA